MVFTLHALYILACQYPVNRSRVENTVQHWRSSKISSMRGRGRQSAFITLFNEQLSTQNLAVPSFLFAIKTGKDQAAEAGTIITASRRLSHSFRINSMCFGAILQER